MWTKRPNWMLFWLSYLHTLDRFLILYVIVNEKLKIFKRCGRWVQPQVVEYEFQSIPVVHKAEEHGNNNNDNNNDNNEYKSDRLSHSTGVYPKQCLGLRPDTTGLR